VNQAPFTANAPGIQLTATTTASASVALPFLQGAPGDTLRIVNEGPNNAYIAVGRGAQTATVPGANQATTCTPVLAGSDVSFQISAAESDLQISAITATGTAVLDVQVGTGF
jgi:hypothetical protein